MKVGGGDARAQNLQESFQVYRVVMMPEVRLCNRCGTGERIGHIAPCFQVPEVGGITHYTASIMLTLYLELSIVLTFTSIRDYLVTFGDVAASNCWLIRNFGNSSGIFVISKLPLPLSLIKYEYSSTSSFHNTMLSILKYAFQDEQSKLNSS